MKITIHTKLLLGFAAVLLLLMVGSAISISKISSTDSSYSQLIKENVENAMMAKSRRARLT